MAMMQAGGNKRFLQIMSKYVQGDVVKAMPGAVCEAYRRMLKAFAVEKKKLGSFEEVIAMVQRERGEAAAEAANRAPRDRYANSGLGNTFVKERPPPKDEYEAAQRAAEDMLSQASDVVGAEASKMMGKAKDEASKMKGMLSQKFGNLFGSSDTPALTQQPQQQAYGNQQQKPQAAYGGAQQQAPANAGYQPAAAPVNQSASSGDNLDLFYGGAPAAAPTPAAPSDDLADLLGGGPVSAPPSDNLMDLLGGGGTPAGANLMAAAPQRALQLRTEPSCDGAQFEAGWTSSMHSCRSSVNGRPGCSEQQLMSLMSQARLHCLATQNELGNFHIYFYAREMNSAELMMAEGFWDGSSGLIEIEFKATQGHMLQPWNQHVEATFSR